MGNGNTNTIAPYKLDGFQTSMDNVHSLNLKDFNIRIRMYIECSELQCCRPNQQSLLLNYFFDFMKQPLFGKNDAIEWQNDKMTKSKIWKIQNNFVILSLFLKDRAISGDIWEKFNFFAQ